MTNEEAIQVIELAKAEVEWEYPLDYQLAFDRAIAALKCMNKDAYFAGYEKGMLDGTESMYKVITELAAERAATDWRLK